MTMKAARVQQWGGSDAVQIETVEIPTLAAPDEVLIRVHASSINPVDWKIREGYLSKIVKLPATLGWDVSGEVVEVGAGVTHVQPGDAVYAMIQVRGGAYAEYAVVKAVEVAHKPQSLDFLQAAAVPLVALTAWQALEPANIQPGQQVLIHAAAGGVGSVAVQLAKLKGASVIGTASQSNEAFTRELGVDEFIDYRSVKFEHVVRDVDVVIDTVGDETLERSHQVVKRGGMLVTLTGQFNEAKVAQYGIETCGVSVVPNPDQLAEIARLIDAGQLKIHISQVFPLEQVREALDLSQTGHVRGKIALKIVQ